MSILPIIMYDDTIYTGSGPLTATTTATSYDVDNITDWRPFTLWKGTGTSTQYLTKDAGAVFTANSFALMGHDFFTQGATIVIQYSTDNFAADTNDAFTPFAPTSNRALYLSFTSQSKRYWRLKITSYTAAPFLGILRIGERLTFPIAMDTDNWDSEAYKIKGSSQTAETGNHLGTTVKYKKLRLRPKWTELDSSWVDGDFKTFWDNSGSLLKKFFWIWNSVNYSSEVYLCSIPPGFNKRFPFQDTTLKRNINLELMGIVE